MARKPTHIYLDPMDAIWLSVADRIGLRVERSEEVFASTDGMGVMTIGDPAALDPDDCLAQMILHELCHSLIEGEDSLAVPDFGLDNLGGRDEVKEHACLRLQAWLTDRYGLRAVLAPTTEFRGYYDGLPADPLRAEADPAIDLAVAGAVRAERPPWAPHLQKGLAATAKVLRAARELEATDPQAPMPPIWRELKG